MSSKHLISLLLLVTVMYSCKPRTELAITEAELRDEIGFLSSDSLKGRYPGTAEEVVLTDYIAKKFRQSGLGLYQKNSIQSFDIIRHISAGENNWFVSADSTFLMDEGFAPMPFSGNGSLQAEVVFAGYGFSINKDAFSWDDYKDIDVAGKWVLILRGNPEPTNLNSLFATYSDDRAKALKAADNGAAGVLFVGGPVNDPEGKLLALKDKKPALKLPVLQLTRSTADFLLQAAGRPGTASLEQLIDSTRLPNSFILDGVMADASSELLPEADKARNVIGILKGSDRELAGQYIIVGAHHDHLGMGGMGSSSRQQDTVAVHHGADDNASGVAGVIEIAGDMLSRKPARSMLFTTFSGEEMGLLGSRFFVDQIPVPIEAVSAMINLDMIGRLDENRTLQISGMGTSPLFQTLVDSINQNYGFTIKASREGYGPSDHASFYAKDIPVLFLSTGAHPDYHTPLDNAERINYEGCAEVCKFASDLAAALASYHDSIPFTEAGPKVKASSAGRYGGITLGIMPDASYEGSEGLPVLFATEGKPAAVGGIRKGDTIVAIEGKSVGNVYDYMSRLGELKEGQSIVVSVKRDSSILNLLVQL